MGKNREWFLTICPEMPSIFATLNISEIHEMDEELSGIPPERYIEELEKLLQNVPLSNRTTARKFLDNRRQVGLLKRQ